MVKRTGLAKTLYLKLLSQPVQDRQVYRQIEKLQAKSVVELGVGTCQRSQRIIASQLRYHSLSEIRYTGIDLFEARQTDEQRLTLKQAHRLLAESGAKVRLIPGDPYSALARSANALTGTDLIVIDASQATAELAPTWFYIPRMLHDRSVVLLAIATDEGRFRRVAPAEVADLAQAAAQAKKRAA